MVVSVKEISAEVVVRPTTTSGTKLSGFKYWSKLLIKSLAPLEILERYNIASKTQRLLENQSPQTQVTDSQ